MARGRKPKHPALKLIEGTLRQDRGALPEDMPAAELAIGLEPPGHLDQYARDAWAEVVPELEKIGVLANLDRQVIAGYCISVSSLVLAEREIDEYGIVIKTFDAEGVLRASKKNPAVNIREGALRELRAFASEFGLTPVSRTRIGTARRFQGVASGDTAGYDKAAKAGRLLD